MPKCKSKRLGTGQCIKESGHVNRSDPRHTDGHYEWGGYTWKESDRASDKYR